MSFCKVKIVQKYHPTNLGNNFKSCKTLQTNIFRQQNMLGTIWGLAGFFGTQPTLMPW